MGEWAGTSTSHGRASIPILWIRLAVRDPDSIRSHISPCVMALPLACLVEQSPAPKTLTCGLRQISLPECVPLGRQSMHDLTRSLTDTPHPGIKFPMKLVGVGSNNLQFYNMVIPDLNATLSGAPTPADPAGFYKTAQMAELAKELGGADRYGSL